MENLLHKIEKLSEDKRQELEVFLEKIVDGSLDIKSLLNFEFADKSISKLPLKFFTNKVEIQPKSIFSSISRTFKEDFPLEKNENFQGKKNEILQKTQKNEIFTEKELQKNEILAETSSKTKNLHFIEGFPLEKKENFPEKEQIQVPEIFPKDKTLIKLRFLSTWGSIHNAGLTELQLFSISNEKISLEASDLQIKNTSFPSNKGLKNLINGIYNTVDEENMWLSYMPAPPDCLELCISVKKDVKIGGVVIWNYNKSLIESVKGVKQMEILMNNELVWNGTVKRGVGNERDDYKEVVRIMKEFEFFVKNDEKIKVENVKEIALKNEIEENLKKNEEVLQRKSISRVHPKTIKLFEEIENNEMGRKMTLNKEEGERICEKYKEKVVENVEKAIEIIEHKPKGKSKIEKLKEMIEENKINEKNTNLFLENNQKKILVEKIKETLPVEKIKETLPIEKIKEKLPVEKIKEKFPELSTKIHEKTVINTQKTAQIREKAPLHTKSFFDDLDDLGLDEKNPEHSLSQDDPNSLEKLRYFNLTNEGRLRPGSRERFLQAEALTVQQDVQNTLKILQSNLDLNEEFDALDVFFKKDLPKSPKKQEKRIKNSEEEFMIPMLPKGRKLTLKLLTTWGDHHYIGLAGLEAFNDRGVPIKLSPLQIKADPADINILPGYGQDPRTIDKLIDGVYLTCDDLHMWLAPFTKNKEHIITIDLGENVKISMIRVWNYNKSRIHSFRGARNMRILLDERVIFIGEVKKASGILENCKESCEYIMFSNEESLLNLIESRDWLNQAPLNYNFDKENLSNLMEDRPKTATKNFENEIVEIEKLLNSRFGDDGRPLTSANKPLVSKKNQEDLRGEIKKEKNFEVIF